MRLARCSSELSSHQYRLGTDHQVPARAATIGASDSTSFGAKPASSWMQLIPSCSRRATSRFRDRFDRPDEHSWRRREHHRIYVVAGGNLGDYVISFALGCSDPNEPMVHLQSESRRASDRLRALLHAPTRSSPLTRSADWSTMAWRPIDPAARLASTPTIWAWRPPMPSTAGCRRPRTAERGAERSAASGRDRPGSARPAWREPTTGEQTGDHLDRLLESAHPRASRIELDARRVVIAAHPTGTETERESTVRDDVERRRHSCREHRVAVVVAQTRRSAAGSNSSRQPPP